MFGFIAQKLTPFVLLFLILIFAFADAFYTISGSLVHDAELNPSILEQDETDPYSARFITTWYDSLKYSYFNAQGEFDTDKYKNLSGHKNVLAWIVFLASTFVNFVIILNLLIAVVNDMYLKANQEQVELNYRAKAGFVLDVKSLYNKVLDKDHHYMLIVQEKNLLKLNNSEEVVDIDVLVDRLEEVSKDVTTFHEKILEI